MEKRALAARKKELQALLAQLEGRAASLTDGVRTSSVDGGNLSSVPMHLGDLGAETYTQELNSVLLETTDQVHTETIEALERIDNGSYGVCERCHRNIIAERLDAVPYARYCVECAEIVADNPEANLNDGRPKNWEQVVPTQRGKKKQPNEDQAPFTDRAAAKNTIADSHAAGTPGGGSAVGGLAGANVGDGDPDDVNLEDAMGSSNFDVEIAGNDQETDTYSGRSGGAVGGTPAGKRAHGGQKKPE